MGKQVAAGSKVMRWEHLFYIDSRLSAIKVPGEPDILMTDKQQRRRPLIQSVVP